MDKWYLSENGNVNGPFDINDVQSIVTKNSNLYGWNPSLSYWLPVSKINEFQEFVPEIKSTGQVSKELIDKFVKKKRDLNKKSTLIEQTIQSTMKALAVYEREIVSYKELTNNLAPEVRDNIEPLEKKYTVINRKLEELKRAADISNQEIDDVVAEFGELVLSKATENVDNIDELTVATPKTKPEVNKNSVKRNMLNADEPIPSVEPIKNELKNRVSDVKSSAPVAKTKQATKPEPTQSDKPAEIPTTEKKNASVVNKQPTDTANTDVEKKGFKNKLKSVFGHGAIEEEETEKLSDKLKRLEQEALDKEANEEDVVYIDTELEVEEELDDDLEPKKKRRRRRRF